jgi:5'-3' exonuclease
MGIKGFSAVFTASPISLKDLKNKTLAVDASLEIYRAALGMASVKGLSDAKGRTTLHISVILSNLIAYATANINTVWVFDYDGSKSPELHNPLKSKELEERREKRAAANARIAKLRDLEDPSESNLFSDSDSDSDEPSIKASPRDIAQEIEKQEKIAFVIQDWMISDIKRILDAFSIKWVESPKGVEAECLAARLTQIDVAEANAVLSSDADALMFGATALVKKNSKTKKYERFILADLLEDKEITQNQLIKMGIVLGSDMYKDKEKKLFFRIGPKSVLAKIKSGTLDQKFEDPEVKCAIEHFEATCEVGALEWHNSDALPYGDCKKVQQLVDWLVDEKNFSRSRITKQLQKAVKI